MRKVTVSTEHWKQKFYSSIEILQELPQLYLCKHNHDFQQKKKAFWSRKTPKFAQNLNSQFLGEN